MNQNIKGEIGDYLRDIWNIPLLTISEERDLFKRISRYTFPLKKFERLLCENKIELLDHERSYLIAKIRFKEVPEFLRSNCTQPLDDETVKYIIARTRILRWWFKKISPLMKKVALSNLRLVISCAKKFRGMGADFKDLISEGNLGLWRAIELFDYRFANKFSIYAYSSISRFAQGEIYNHARIIRLPTHLYSRGLVKGQEHLISLDQNYHGESYQKYFFSDEPLLELRRLVEKFLTKREFEVIKMRFGFDCQEPKTLEEVSQKLGITRERIRQLERQVLLRLKSNKVIIAWREKNKD